MADYTTSNDLLSLPLLLWALTRQRQVSRSLDVSFWKLQEPERTTLTTLVLNPHIQFCVTLHFSAGRAAAAIPSPTVSMTSTTVSALPTLVAGKDNLPMSYQVLLATSEVATAPSRSGFAGIVQPKLFASIWLDYWLLACFFQRSAHCLWHSLLVRNCIHVSETLELILSACRNASSLSPTSKDSRTKTTWCRVFCIGIPSCEIGQLHSNQSSTLLSRGKVGKKELYSV